MTDRENVIKALELCTSKIETRTQVPCEACSYHNTKYHGVLGDGCCNIRSLHRDCLALLKAQEPRVMTLEEVKHLTYGSPYIIETNLRNEEPRLMYGLFSHLGLQGTFTFAFTDWRSYLFDVDYGKRWRCWTSRPTEAQKEATPWTQTNGL